MGFFKKLFGSKWRKCKERGDGYFDAGEWGRARAEFNEAIRSFEAESPADEIEKVTMRERLAIIDRKLLEMHLGEAERFETTGMAVRASEHLRTAMEFIHDDKQREEILTRIGAIEATFAEPDHKGLAKQAGPPPAAGDLDAEFESEMAFTALLGAMDDDRADIYEALGAEFRKGFLALMNGELEAADAVLGPVLEADPQNPWLRFEVARLRLAQDNYTDAEQLFRQAAELAPEALPILHTWIQALWGLEQWERAERVVEQAFEIDDQDINNFVLAGQTCLRSGEFENGVEIVEAGVEAHERSITLYRLLGKLHMAAENAVAAQEAFESALGLRWVYDYETGQLQFDTESAFLAAGLYLQTRTNMARAEELYRSLLATGDDQNKPAFLAGAAQAMIALGNPDDAKKYLVDAASMLDEDADQRKIVEKLLADL
jgi:tetratricopeptide (TPR) repeat protein